MQKTRIESEVYNVHRTFLIKTDRASFIAAYIAYGILENATQLGGVRHFKERSRFTGVRVCCTCGQEMQEGEQELVCPRCDLNNRISKEMLIMVFRSELKSFLESVRKESSTIHSIGIQRCKEYIKDYQDRFDLIQKENLNSILGSDEESGAVDLKIDALLEEAAQFQYAITKITPEWWERKFGERLEKLLLQDMSDELIEMQIRCVVVGEVCEQGRTLNVGYTLPFAN